MLMSPHRMSSRPSLMQRPRPVDEALQEAQLRAVVLPAVRHVDRREHEIVERNLHDARLDVELGMGEFRRVQELVDAGAATRRSIRRRRARTRGSRRACSGRAPGRAAP